MVTKTSGANSGSTDALSFSFLRNDKEVWNTELRAKNRWTAPGMEASFDFGLQPWWDTVTITQNGQNAIGFVTFSISCSNGKSLDLVELAGCSDPKAEVWFDKFPAGVVSHSCYKYAVQVRTAALSDPPPTKDPPTTPGMMMKKKGHNLF